MIKGADYMTSRLASALMSLVPYVDEELKKEIYEFLPTLLKQTKEIQLDSDSSGGGEFQESISEELPPEEEEEEEPEVEDSASFLVPDDKILKTYSDEELFKKKTNPKRNSKKRSTFDPSEYHDQQEDASVEELGSEDDVRDKLNRDQLALFKKKLDENPDKVDVLGNDRWFQKEFGDVIDNVTAQLGNDSKGDKHKKALERFCLIAEACLNGGIMPDVEVTVTDGFCQFCTEKRPSNHAIYVYDKPYYVGSNCMDLMNRVITFFKCLGDTERQDHEAHYLELKKLLSDIPLGNAMKKNRGKDPDEGKVVKRRKTGGRRRK